MGRSAKFNKKAFVSFSVFFIWIIISLTGIVLYFTPPGRIANWINWKFLGLAKEQWQAIHTIFAFLFVIAAAFHLYFNWVVFWSYIKSKVVAGIKMKRELVTATISVGIVLIITLLNIPPSSTIMDFGEYLSNSWGNSVNEPSIPHAEKMTLKEYSDLMRLDLDMIIQRLKTKGLKGVDASAVIGELAALNNMTPKDLTLLFERKSGTNKVFIPVSGYGRKTVKQISRELGIPFKTAKAHLNQYGINFDNQETIRSIAYLYNLKPYQIVDIIKGENIQTGDQH